MPNKQLDKLKNYIKTLRADNTGCAWTRKLDYKSLLKHSQEEIIELSDAIYQNDISAIKDELSDLLYHLLLYVQIASENGEFTLNDLAKHALEKQQARTPSATLLTHNPENIHEQWQTSKFASLKNKQHYLLEDLKNSAYPLSQAEKIQTRVAHFNFDWPSYHAILDKLDEEIAELTENLENKAPHTDLEDELGDVLFTVINLARKIEINPEYALKKTIHKFITRFNFIEDQLNNENEKLENCDLEKLERYWNMAKKIK